MTDAILLILSTFPSQESAEKAVETLVIERLCACGNIISSVNSLYIWKDALCKESEVLVLFKSTMARYKEFEARLLELHPYEVPEVVSFNPSNVSSEYEKWVIERTTSK